ncbi:hypothetical protein ThidrDRAFT_1880 [Thiorhodococcus drewsii AZ1]|uniref:Uncharacterized protein n=1 Tax=Thiorhodococcus drewsii AZ1 TaxID=765913 RepID=G2E0Q7_9GAMM|nr:hypothetical protein [Thiorhodococcus drewsii]EGV31679.1 hypothetical protein ThidrDRAFT_1880 [Thiorhodococcus drewsii AZ1]
MKKPGFGEGVLVALVAAILGAVVFDGLTLLVPASVAANWVLMGLGFGYVLYLLGRADPSVGRLPLFLLWLAVTLVSWSLTSDFGIFCLAQLAVLWLVRALCFHAGPVAAAMDLGLFLLGGLAGFWAAQRTGSPFLVIWTCFLVQAFFVYIRRPTGAVSGASVESDAFGQAERAAERALSRLSRF